MSFEIKMSFLKDLERTLSDRITATALTSVMSAAADVLEHYEFSRMLRIEDAFSLDLLDTWISALKVEGRSQKTVQAYSYLINRLLKDLNVPIRNITVYHLRNWLTKEKERGISDGTLKGNREVFSSMFGWLWREGLIEKNPVANIGAIKVQKKIREPYADVELENLKSACGKSKLPDRDIAVISFLLSTGCRVSEMTQLNRDDINFIDKEVTVLGKGNKERVVYFDDVTAMYLRRYLDARQDLCPALFANIRHNRLQQNGVRVMLKRMAKIAGVEHAHPHKFRRTLATMLIAHGMPIQEVAAILGHEKLDTTMKYIALDKSQVKNSYKKFA
jgi:site-specific recombinase XerD